MSEPIVTFSHPAGRDPAVTGGKGAALARLVAAGLPVPDGFVVTAGAFARATDGLLPEIDGALAKADPADLVALRRLCQKVQKLITSQRPPSAVVDAVQEAYERLGASSVAVRSSATAEDLPTASFAGQYESFLNVLGADAVLERVLHVWASLYSVHAVSYRRRQGIADANVRMAVVVQHVLRAEASGVLFTRDPVSGAEDQYLVSAALGLGEGVVDGSVPVDQFTIHPETAEVLSREVASKGHMVALDPEGGVRRVEVETDRRAKPALSDGHLGELGRLARSVRELFGGHQDIEFAVVDGDVRLLQARPVTGVDAEPEFPVRWEDPADGGYTWLLFTRGQRDVLPARRLEEDAQRVYFEGSRICFEETGSLMARNHIVCFINGYCYARPPEVEEAEITERLRIYSALAEKLDEKGTTVWEGELRPPVERVLEKLGRFRPRGASLPALVEHLEHATDAFAHVLGDLHWRLAAANTNLREDWPTVYHEITGEPNMDAGVFLQAIENKTTRMVRWLRELARLAQGDSTLGSLFEERAYERLDDPNVRARPAVRRFRSRFGNFLRRHGRRTGRGFGSAANFATPTWGMETKHPLELIRSYAQQDLDEMERMEREARRERERAMRRVRRLLASDADAQARFERSLRRAVNGVRMMENHNHMMEQATGGALREAVYRVGQRLVHDGMLDHPDDVLHLSFAELKDVTAGRASSDLRALVKERSEEFERRSRLKPPKTLGSGGPPPLDLERRFDPPPNVGRDGSLLRGVASSRGRATGRARVTPPSAEPPTVEKGDILVAVNAGPNWTPIFPLLGGLVLDQGVAFQHAALVAREYRIPTVLMTRDGTTEIQDGQTITVDGDQGVVELTP